MYKPRNHGTPPAFSGLIYRVRGLGITDVIEVKEVVKYPI